MDAGKYTLVVDAEWNDCVKLDELYDDILVRVYSVVNNLKLTKVDDHIG